MNARLRELLAPVGPSLDLAALRITVALVLLSSGSIASAERWAALPEAARTAPYGVGWLLPYLVIDPATVHVVRLLFQLACLCGALGLFSRGSFIVVSITASYLLLIPQLGGAVFHDHHLLWLAVIVAASPCGDALSLDAWLARRSNRVLPTEGRAHGAAVRAAWLVIGLVFLFPGIHKLRESGLEWALSDNLRNQMWWKWAQDPALLPSLRIDRYPLLCRTLAAMTIVFELTFLPLVFHPRTRALAVFGALLFHAGSEVFMGIQFSVLWACYPMFIPWQALLLRMGMRSAPPNAEPERSLRPLAWAGVPLLLGIVGFGLSGQMQAYPFACYPTFEWIAADDMPAMAIEVEDASGALRPLDRDRFQEAGPRGWALSWRLIGVYGAFDPAALEAWWRDAASREPLAGELEGVTAVHFYRASISVDPDRGGEVSSRRELVTLP
jgi:hypothetical protein